MSRIPHLFSLRGCGVFKSWFRLSFHILIDFVMTINNLMLLWCDCYTILLTYVLKRNISIGINKIQNYELIYTASAFQKTYCIIKHNITYLSFEKKYIHWHKQLRFRITNIYSECFSKTYCIIKHIYKKENRKRLQIDNAISFIFDWKLNTCVYFYSVIFKYCLFKSDRP